MKDNNQTVIFLLSEEATPAEIILDILKKNEINDPTDDFEDESKTPRLVIVNEATKDFFEKKITEEKMSELFQNELKISKETAMGIINDIKVRLIPYAKKILNEPAVEKKLEVREEKDMDIFPKIEPLASTIKSTKENLPPPIKADLASDRPFPISTMVESG